MKHSSFADVRGLPESSLRSKLLKSTVLKSMNDSLYSSDTNYSPRQKDTTFCLYFQERKSSKIKVCRLTVNILINETSNLQHISSSISFTESKMEFLMVFLRVKKIALLLIAVIFCVH